MDNYNFTKFHQNQMKNKNVLLIACFSVQNFKVSVESWKLYIVRNTAQPNDRSIIFFNTDSTPHSVPSISPQKSHAVTRMHLLLLFHNFSYLLFSMLLQALGWFWCKKYRVSINETGGGRRIVLWANRICKTCRNYYTYIYYLLSLFSTFSFLWTRWPKTYKDFVTSFT